MHDRVAALAAGLDLEMPPDLGFSDAALASAVRGGRLDEGLLDTAVCRVLDLVARAPSVSGPEEPVDAEAHHALAREVARECAVLLKNDGGLLPLRPGVGQTVAVIGELARTPRYQGAGSSQVNPTRLDGPLEELRAGALDGVEVQFAAGYGLAAAARDEELAAEAVALARAATTVILFLGLPEEEESEGFDRRHMELPAAQTALVARLAEVNPRVVVVLANGSVVSLHGWEERAAAVLECWLAGQAGGGAVADLLLGVASPSGRLAETVPVRLEDNPAHLSFPGEEGHVRYGEGVFVGYRGYDALRRPVQYPFGHGLSYTTFEYTDLRAVTSGTVPAGDLAVDVTVTVTNAGKRRGKEVAQLYVGDPEASVARPDRELRGFQKLDLGPGENARAAFRLDARDLSYWSTARGGWHLEPGAFVLAVGASSRDLRLSTTIEVSAPPTRRRLDAMSTLEEWLADPVGAPALRAAVGTDATGRAAGILGDEELIRVIGNFPIGRLAAFPGLGITHPLVETLLAGQAEGARREAHRATRR